MKDLFLMIKPSSSKCNLNCKYCFYKTIAKSRDIEDYGFMKHEVLEEIVKKSIKYSNGGLVVIGFQGGEPTLIGIDYYKRLMEYIEIYNVNNTKFQFVIQTNGILLDEEWVRFFKENNFLVGISLDGTKIVHNRYRTDYNNNGSHNIVMKKIRMLEKANVEYNILTVVTNTTCKRISSIYKFYRENDFRYLQFIPYLDPMERSNEHYGKYGPTPEEYGDFLNSIFNMWYKDIKEGRWISIRYFDNLISSILGYGHEACDMNGICSCQNIVEADGSIYPCDFYTYEKYRIGNILEDDFEDIFTSNILREFINYSIENIDEECLKCRYRHICSGGCRRYRENQYGNKNVLCKGFKKFFDSNLNKLQEVAYFKYAHY